MSGIIYRREHKLTHPILGVVTWKSMQAARDRIRKETGRKVCTWCHREVTPGRRTQCGKEDCAEMIWRASSWARCAQVAMRAVHYRCVCGRGATEVDHKIPVSLGGTGDQENLRPLCHDCHREATKRLRREKAAYRAELPPPQGALPLEVSA